MKLINEGNGKWRPWWFGKQMKCNECGQIVELEMNDTGTWNWMPTIDDSVAIRCERCGNTVKIEREPVVPILGVPEKYSELIMAVCRKFPNETRHETALRYIRETETRLMVGEACKEAT